MFSVYRAYSDIRWWGGGVPRSPFLDMHTIWKIGHFSFFSPNLSIEFLSLLPLVYLHAAELTFCTKLFCYLDDSTLLKEFCHNKLFFQYCKGKCRKGRDGPDIKFSGYPDIIFRVAVRRPDTESDIWRVTWYPAKNLEIYLADYLISCTR